MAWNPHFTTPKAGFMVCTQRIEALKCSNNVTWYDRFDTRLNLDVRPPRMLKLDIFVAFHGNRGNLVLFCKQKAANGV